MAERPQPLIRQSIVVSLFNFLIEPNSAQRIPGVIGWHFDVVERVSHQLVRIATAVGNPNTARSTHDGVQRRRHAAGGSDALDSPLVHRVHIRLAVRDNDELHIAEAGTDQILKRLTIPSEFL